jgi:hypothetical protein
MQRRLFVCTNAAWLIAHPESFVLIECRGRGTALEILDPLRFPQSLSGTACATVTHSGKTVRKSFFGETF